MPCLSRELWLFSFKNSVNKNLSEVFKYFIMYMFLVLLKSVYRIHRPLSTINTSLLISFIKYHPIPWWIDYLPPIIRCAIIRYSQNPLSVPPVENLRCWLWIPCDKNDTSAVYNPLQRSVIHQFGIRSNRCRRVLTI